MYCTPWPKISYHETECPSNWSVHHKSAFRHGLLIYSSELSDGHYSTLAYRYQNMGHDELPEMTNLEIGPGCEDSLYQAIDINPILQHIYFKNSIDCLLASGSQLIIGQLSAGATRIHFGTSHMFRELERIISIKHAANGKSAFVSCSGGFVYQISVPFLRVLDKIKITGSAVKDIIAVDGLRITVLTYHDVIMELDFYYSPPIQSPHRIDLSSFSGSDDGSWKVGVSAEGQLIVARINSDWVGLWSWSQPARPLEVYHFPGKQIVDMAMRADKSCMLLYSSPSSIFDNFDDI